MAPHLYQYCRLLFQTPLVLHSTYSYQMDHDILERHVVVNWQILDMQPKLFNCYRVTGNFFVCKDIFVSIVRNYSKQMISYLRLQQTCRKTLPE